MTKNRERLMEESSKIIVYGLEFQEALKAAMAVAGREPYDVIQLRTGTDGLLRVCARDAERELIVAIDVNTEMLDVVADRDEVIEISMSDARQLAAQKVKQEKGEDPPMVGLIIRESSIRRTDESGLGLGIRKSEVRRAAFPGEPTAAGDIPAMLWAAAESESGGLHTMSAEQGKKLAAAAGALDTRLEFQPLAATEELDSRVLITSMDGRLVAFAAHRKEQPAEQDQEKPSSDVQALDGMEISTSSPSFADHLEDVGLRVVRANPRGGAV